MPETEYRTQAPKQQQQPKQQDDDIGLFYLLMHPGAVTNRVNQRRQLVTTTATQVREMVEAGNLVGIRDMRKQITDILGKENYDIAERSAAFLSPEERGRRQMESVANIMQAVGRPTGVAPPPTTPPTPAMPPSVAVPPPPTFDPFGAGRVGIMPEEQLRGLLPTPSVRPEAPVLTPTAPIGPEFELQSINLTADGSVTARFGPGSDTPVWMAEFTREKESLMQEGMSEHEASLKAGGIASEITKIIPQNLPALLDSYAPTDDMKERLYWATQDELYNEALRDNPDADPQVLSIQSMRVAADITGHVPTDRVRDIIYPSGLISRGRRISEATDIAYQTSMARFEAAADEPIPGAVKAELGIIDPEIRTYTDLTTKRGEQYLKTPDQRKAYAFLIRAKGAVNLLRKLSRQVHTSKGGLGARGIHTAKLKGLAFTQRDAPETLGKKERSLASAVLAYDRMRKAVTRMFMSVAGETAARLSDFDAENARGMAPLSGIGEVLELVDSKEVAENNWRDLEDLIDASVEQVLKGTLAPLPKAPVPTQEATRYKKGEIYPGTHEGRKVRMKYIGYDSIKGEHKWQPMKK